MKIDRLLEILILLMGRDTVTAPELAERFGVSTRTIYRDIDILSSSGVPVYMSRGAGGGISLLGEYTLPKALVSSEEKNSILLSLQTLQATKYPDVDRIIEKLGSLFRTTPADWVEIDFSPWGSNPNEQDKFSEIRSAILNSNVMTFDYINAQNQRSARRIEPLRLLFKGPAWYLQGWCLDRQDYRLFRVSRMRGVQVTGERFDRNRPRTAEHHRKLHTAPVQPIVHLVARVDASALYRLYDDFEDSFIQPNGDGTYTLTVDFPEDEWVYGYILGYGPKMEVLEPPYLRRLIRERAEAVAALYSADSQKK